MDAIPLPMIFLSVLCGVVPPLVWLYFMLHEDRIHPEPRTLIFISFMAGMLAVPLVVPIESLASSYFTSGLPLITAWAVIEEVAKFAMVALFILWRKEVDESLDVVIYILTVSLGFAALENTLFLLTPFASGSITVGLTTDNLRFVGSTLLHVIATSAIAFPLAFAFNKGKSLRTLAAIGGLILAVALHSLFNFFIINENGSQSMLAFFFVWTGAIIFFALFEILKYEEFRHYPLPPDILRVWQTNSDDLSLSDSPVSVPAGEDYDQFDDDYVPQQPARRIAPMAQQATPFTQNITPTTHDNFAQDDEPSEGQLPVDVYQTPSEIVIRTFIAGVRSDEINVSISRDMVTIEGAREEHASVSDTDYFHHELFWGSFSRTILLPQEIDVENSSAGAKDGLLTIILPKLDKAKQTKLRIKAGKYKRSLLSPSAPGPGDAGSISG